MLNDERFCIRIYYTYELQCFEYYRYCGCPACVCVSVRSFLPPRASRPRNMGTYVFTVTQKTLLYIRIIIVIFVENASFRSYGVICLPRMSLSTPEPQKRILTESTQRGHDITIRDSKIKTLRSEVTAHSFTFFVCISPI